MTTHYMEEAEALSDRVGIMRDGQLLALDTVDNLRSSYGHPLKITYEVVGSDRTESLQGADDAELVARVRAMGAREYAVAPTTLEDIYLALTGDGEAE